MITEVLVLLYLGFVLSHRQETFFGQTTEITEKVTRRKRKSSRPGMVLVWSKPPKIVIKVQTVHEHRFAPFYQTTGKILAICFLMHAISMKALPQPTVILHYFLFTNNPKKFPTKRFQR